MLLQPSFFRPTCIPNLKLWLETDTASYPTAVVFPSNVVTNGDFETGDPPTGWTIIRGTISRQAGTRTGGSGSYVSRLAYDGVNTNAGIYQSGLVIGNTYRLTGYARASAAGGVPAMADGVTFQWTGTTSTDWQAFDVTFVSTGTTCSLYGSSLSAGKYVEFDDVSLMPIHVSQLTDLSDSALHIQRSTASLQPTWVANVGLDRGFARFDGTSDYMISPAASSSWRFLHLAAGSTVIALVKIASASSGDNQIFDTCNKTASNTGIMLAYDAAATRFEYRVAMANAAWHFNCNASASKNAWHIVTAAFSDAEGYYLQVDDGTPSTGAVTGAAVDYNPSYTAYLGARASGTYFNGDLAGLAVYSGRLSLSQIARVKRYLTRKAAMLGIAIG